MAENQGGEVGTMTDEQFKEDVVKYLMHILACLNQIRDQASNLE